jgi:hypothetical protein
MPFGFQVLKKVCLLVQRESEIIISLPPLDEWIDGKIQSSFLVVFMMHD